MVQVQRKLPATLREILDKQGSKVDAHGLLVHHGVTQGGSLSYASSGLIQVRKRLFAPVLLGGQAWCSARPPSPLCPSAHCRAELPIAPSPALFCAVVGSQLPRPVDPAVYTKQLPHYSGGELELREELVTANAGSFNVGELLIKLKMAKDVQQLGEEQHASTFGRSPSPPRRRAV